MTRTISVRKACGADAPTIGALHVASWRETYAGLLPDEQMANLSPSDRSAMWAAVLENPVGATAVLVAEDQATLVGFAACAPQRDPDLAARGFAGEVGALYVRRANQGVGVGSALIGALARRLLDRGLRSAGLWVLRDNAPARRFYERRGGVEIAVRGGDAPEVAYGWSDASLLLRP